MIENIVARSQMKKILICLLFVSCLFADNWRDLNQLHRILKDIDLNEDQCKQVRQLFKAHLNDVKQWWCDRANMDISIMRLFTQGQFDKNKIENTMKTIADRRIEINLKFLRDLHSVLNQNYPLR